MTIGNGCAAGIASANSGSAMGSTADAPMGRCAVLNWSECKSSISNVFVQIGMLTRLPLTIGDDCAAGVASDGSASAEEGLDRRCPNGKVCSSELVSM